MNATFQASIVGNVATSTVRAAWIADNNVSESTYQHVFIAPKPQTKPPAKPCKCA